MKTVLSLLFVVVLAGLVSLSSCNESSVTSPLATTQNTDPNSNFDGLEKGLFFKIKEYCKITPEPEESDYYFFHTRECISFSCNDCLSNFIDIRNDTFSLPPQDRYIDGAHIEVLSYTVECIVRYENQDPNDFTFAHWEAGITPHFMHDYEFEYVNGGYTYTETGLNFPAETTLPVSYGKDSFSKDKISQQTKNN